MNEQRTVTISLSPDLAKRIDAVANQEGRSRSELFREAARQYLEHQERWDRLFALGEATVARTGIDEAAVLETVKSNRRAPSKKR